MISFLGILGKIRKKVDIQEIKKHETEEKHLSHPRGLLVMQRKWQDRFIRTSV